MTTGPFIIAVDFDGTCVDHRYPDVGHDVPGAVRALEEFVARGAKIVLWTMRSSLNATDGDVLQPAIDWFNSRGIPLYGVNNTPEQDRWTMSPKAYAHIYIDDAAFGCPLHENPRMGGMPYVDWSVIGPAVRDLIDRHYSKGL